MEDNTQLIKTENKYIRWDVKRWRVLQGNKRVGKEMKNARLGRASTSNKIARAGSIRKVREEQQRPEGDEGASQVQTPGARPIRKQTVVRP